MVEGAKLINYRIYRYKEESRFVSLECFCELGRVFSNCWRMARDVHFLICEVSMLCFRVTVLLYLVVLTWCNFAFCELH